MSQEYSFEQAMKRLEEIVKQMEQGNVSLEESLKLFEEGTALAASCHTQLDTAELKIVKLILERAHGIMSLRESERKNLNFYFLVNLI